MPSLPTAKARVFSGSVPLSIAKTEDKVVSRRSTTAAKEATHRHHKGIGFLYLFIIYAPLEVVDIRSSFLKSLLNSRHSQLVLRLCKLGR
jgi:hypothetical protein